MSQIIVAKLVIGIFSKITLCCQLTISLLLLITYGIKSDANKTIRPLVFS